MKEQRPKVGLATLIRKEGKILFGKRKGESGYGKWCVPGGHLEYFETFDECAVRETREETGIEIENVQFATATNDMFQDGAHYITIIMVADWKSGEVQLMEPDKFFEWRWAPWDNIPEPAWDSEIELVERGFDPFDM